LQWLHKTTFYAAKPVKKESEMTPASVFIQGIISVFFGMTLLYMSIKITAFFVNRFTSKSKGVAQDDK
jgi:hypothetical protein